MYFVFLWPLKVETTVVADSLLCNKINKKSQIVLIKKPAYFSLCKQQFIRYLLVKCSRGIQMLLVAIIYVKYAFIKEI